LAALTAVLVEIAVALRTGADSTAADSEEVVDFVVEADVVEADVAEADVAGREAKFAKDETIAVARHAIDANPERWTLWKPRLTGDGDWSK
jgi:hypothetical protein